MAIKERISVHAARVSVDPDPVRSGTDEKGRAMKYSDRIRICSSKYTYFF